MKAIRTLSVLLAFLLMAWTAAQLEVDSAGGPLTLPEQVAAALDIWRQALAPEVLEEPAARIAFAPELLGPDTSSLTLLYGDGRTEVLLSPARYEATPVLVHEMGVLLGLPATGSGVMDPAIGPDTPGQPTATDVALLRELRTYPAADLTRDGAVDFYDLAAFGAAYGSVGINLRADLNGDGRVDDEDLSVLVDSYAFSAPAQSPPATQNLSPAVGAPNLEGDSEGADTDPSSPDAAADTTAEPGPEDAAQEGDGAGESEAPDGDREGR